MMLSTLKALATWFVIRVLAVANGFLRGLLLSALIMGVTYGALPCNA